jgi:hypothetical protein
LFAKQKIGIIIVVAGADCARFFIVVGARQDPVLQRDDDEKKLVIPAPKTCHPGA